MPAKPPSPSTPTQERIEDVDVSAEMQGSYLEYAYSVIYSRALPDARDGLKPVQRRILYQMAEMGLRPDRGHVKSARVVGEVMGKLHPHGDSAIYDALVRLAQPFTLRVPLVDGHGNFGSLDDGPAAARYTEARLAPPALALTESLDEDVVDFVPNYDGQFQQPSVLPAAFPNLLVNGASGIAVGMATNMAPHNLVEVSAAAVHLLENPEATVEDLMEFVPGPDLPGGGVITGVDGIKEAYQTGRGSFRTRAKVSVEHLGPRRTGLVVTELPYLVGPERVIEKIKDAVTAKKLTGVADVADLTDRKNGLRLVITVNDADADSEYFKCFVSAGVRRESVETIFTRIFGEGIRKPETFFFNPAHLLPGCPDALSPWSERTSAELPALVARLAMPVLDLARDIRGLDRVMNDPPRFPFVQPPHPQAPQNLADCFVSLGRQSCLKTLIVSWLAGSSDFETRVAALRAFVRARVDVSEAHLDLLLSGLRSSEQPRER